jgi:hypothetical protein
MILCSAGAGSSSVRSHRSPGHRSPNARLIVEDVIADAAAGIAKRRRVVRLQSRRQLFPQAFRFVQVYGSWQIFSGIDLHMVRFIYGTSYAILQGASRHTQKSS